MTETTGEGGKVGGTAVEAEEPANNLIIYYGYGFFSLA